MHGEGIIILFVLAIVITPIALLIWLVTRANESRRRLDELARRLGTVELNLHRLKTASEPSLPQPEPATAPVAAPSPLSTKLIVADRPKPAEVPKPTPTPPALPPPLTLKPEVPPLAAAARARAIPPP